MSTWPLLSRSEAGFVRMDSLKKANPRMSSRVVKTLPFILSAFVLIWMLFTVLLGLSPCLLSSQTTCYRGYQSRFSFNVDEADHSSWMARIPDDTNLTSLSIPGTHDTLTFDVEDELFQCQNHDLDAQLRGGVRYVDVRGRLVNDTIQIYHASAYTGYTYADVLHTVFEFLEENPSETIIMRMKDEARPYGHNTLTFEGAFNWYLHESPDTSEEFQRRYWKPDPSTPLPTLGALRGKIFLLQNFSAKDGGPYGIIWEGDDMVLEDLWIIPSMKHLYMKWEAVEKALIRAAEADDSNDVLYLSHLSASVGVLPIQAAAGWRNGTIAGINDQTGTWLEKQRWRGSNNKALRARHGDHDDEEGEEEEMGEMHYGKTGVVIIDFPGRELVDAILERNSGLAIAQ